MRTLWEDMAGTIRDPQVHYDGRRVLCSYRPGGQEHLIDAKPIPSSHHVVATFCEHMAPDHAGYVAVVDPTRGPDDPRTARRISLEDVSRDPYPLGEAGFLAAQDNRLVLMNHEGLTQTVYELPQTDGEPRWLVREPRPLAARDREPMLPDRTAPDSPTGQLVLADIYRGRKMAGVARGEIRKLLVMEQLPKPVNLTGGMAPLSYYGTFTLQRVLGTVPVEPDGAARFEVPALRELFFVALDEHDRAVKRMQSFLTAQPGEVIGCVGCHEPRTSTPAPVGMLAALNRSASPIEPIADLGPGPRSDRRLRGGPGLLALVPLTFHGGTLPA